ncbi:MAG: alpha/beta hydrolase [Cryomorphaceae bacterium]|nr:MAG: alpha/beta hydrolase [Cryomorphaceae bacterium]
MSYQIQQDGKFRYLEKGEGRVIMILHGLFGALSNFDGVIGHFSKTHKVVVPLMPLYDMPITKTSVKNLAKYIEDFVDHKGYKDVILLGNSLGGHVALVYTLKRMEKVGAMVLTGSSGLYENAFGGSFPRRSDKDYIRGKIAVTFHDPAMVTDELVDVVFDLVSDRGKLLKVLYLAKSAIRHNMRDELPNYKMPVCLIWGKNDTITPPEVAEEFNEFLPDSDLFWIDKCAHAPMMEHPETFNGILDGWLKQRGLV